MSEDTPGPDHKGPERDYILSNGTYNFLKQTVQIGLPASGALYFALAQIWGFPKAEEVVGSIAAISAFLGIFLGYSSHSYNNSEAKYDGVIDVAAQEFGKTLFMLNLDSDPENLDQKKEVTFKINPS